MGGIAPSGVGRHGRLLGRRMGGIAPSGVGRHGRLLGRLVGFIRAECGHGRGHQRVRRVHRVARVGAVIVVHARARVASVGLHQAA